MATNYPGSLDSYTTKTDFVDLVEAEDINDVQDAIVAIETELGTDPAGAFTDVVSRLDDVDSRQPDKNLLYHTLTHDLWQEGTTFNDPSDDTYVADLWGFLWDSNAPDVTGQAGGSNDPFTRYLRVTHDANSQAGIVQFLTAEDSKSLRGKTLSLSADLWGNGVVSLRMAVLVWTGTADSITSDVVGTWSTGNPTLATSWAYIGTPASITIDSSRTRYSVDGLTIPTTANNLGVFVWTDAVEANTDLWNVARAQLEISETATPFTPRPFNQERLRVNEFLVRLNNVATVVGNGTALNTTTARIIIPTLVKMRATPTVTGTLANFTIRGGGGAAIVPTSFTIPFAFENGVRLSINDSGAGLIANYAYSLYADTGPLTLDARL